jgi:hypothetical protein
MVFADIEKYNVRETISGFSLVSGQASTYSYPSPGYIGAVWEDNSALTVKTSIAEVEATASTWYWDSSTDILYVHISTGEDPDTVTIKIAPYDYEDLLTYCRNNAMEELESYLDPKFPRPLPFAKNSYNSAKYDTDIIRSCAMITVRMMIELVNPTSPLVEIFWKKVYSEDEPVGLLAQYKKGMRAFSFQNTVDDFDGRLENIILDSTSTGRVYLAGKGMADDHHIYRVKIDTAGAVETATYKYSDDDGRTWISTLNTTYNQYTHLVSGVWIRFEGTFVLNDEWKIEIAGGPDEAIGATIKNIRLVR